jgi:serine/threonine protein phosphatase 1
MGKRNKQHQPAFEMATRFREIFIGHTSTTYWDTDKPMNAGNIWNVDTGAGNRGRLTIMEVSTKTYWQSDLVEDLYDALR